ncbi:MAG: flavodoxin family protein [Candidatus Bathyarchaeales archaeon]
MGLKVVGIISSPRKGKTTDTLVTKVLEGALSVGAETKKIYLNDLAIKPCQACDKHPAPDFCIYKNGMEEVYLALKSADVIVVGTPAYYDSISAQLKLVVDRSNCLTEMTRLPDGKVMFQSRLKKRKKGVFIWVADFSRNPEHALGTIRLWFKDANIELVDTLIVTNSDKREARNREDLLQKAFQLGVSLGRLL